MLTQNREMRKDGIWNWTLPAWVVELSDGSKFNACPNAGACKDLCYARNGTYLFPQVKAAHLRNLEATLNDLPGWEAAMISELKGKKFRPTGKPRMPELIPLVDPWMQRWLSDGGQAIRIHDSGDFYSDEYLRAWIRIADATPDVLFYAYTKEVSRLRAHEDLAPWNFRWLYSLGGQEDHLIDKDQDRHADVFTSKESMEELGYQDQSMSDLHAILLPTSRIGIPANNIRHFRKRQGSETFGQIEAGKIRHGRGKA